MEPIFPIIENSDGPPPVGVMLSIPLDPKSHVLNNGPEFDIEKSWSTSSSIHLRREVDGYSVSVDVYNLGLSPGLVFVELVLWYLAADGSRTSATMPHALNLLIPAARAGGTAGTIRTAETKIVVAKGQRLTHVYAVTYDPFFDKSDRWSGALLRASVPDFRTNPARLSRQIGCLNVFYADEGYAFNLEWEFKGSIGHLSPTVRNPTGAPVDVCIVKATNVTHRTSLGYELTEIIEDVRVAVGRITSSEREHPVLMSQHPGCDPNCSRNDPNKFRGVGFYFLQDRGVTIDGKHKGKGLIVDVPDLTFQTPWSPGNDQVVSLRLLLR